MLFEMGEGFEGEFGVLADVERCNEGEVVGEDFNVGVCEITVN